MAKFAWPNTRHCTATNLDGIRADFIWMMQFLPWLKSSHIRFDKKVFGPPLPQDCMTLPQHGLNRLQLVLATSKVQPRINWCAMQSVEFLPKIWSMSDKIEYKGSGCGSVGRAVASNTWGPQFDSSHGQNLFGHLFIFNCIEKTKINKNRPGVAHFFLKKRIYRYSSRESLISL